MKKIILIANTEWYLYNFRRNLGKFLQDQGYEVVMLSPPGPYAEKLQALGFRWVSWPVGRKTLAPWAELGALLHLLKIYRKERPDLVHHHTIKPCLYGSIAGRLQDVPVVVNSITGRGYVFLGTDILARLLRMVVKPMYRFAFGGRNCRVIFENPVDQNFFINEHLVPAERTHLIASVGVDVRQFQPAPWPTGAPIIVFASRMLWDKGVGVLVDAARLLAQWIPEEQAFKVVLAGQPDPGNPASIPIETIQEWVAEGIVEWWGFQEDMNAVYNRGHIVTLPTMYGEGVPTVLIEAGACGRPLVATKMPGCEDVVEEGVNGFLVAPGNAHALADALKKLILDPALRQKMGQRSRQVVMERFTIDIVNAATAAVYEEI